MLSGCSGVLRTETLRAFELAGQATALSQRAMPDYLDSRLPGVVYKLRQVRAGQGKRFDGTRPSSLEIALICFEVLALPSLTRQSCIAGIYHAKLHKSTIRLHRCPNLLCLTR